MYFDKHGLPVWPASTVASLIGSNDNNTILDQPHGHLRSNLTPTQMAFNCSFKKFELNFKAEEVDLLDFMTRMKEIIYDLIFVHVQEKSIKMQLSVEVSMIKHISGEEEEPEQGTRAFPYEQEAGKANPQVNKVCNE